MAWSKVFLVEQIPFHKVKHLWEGGEMSHPFLLALYLAIKMLLHRPYESSPSLQSHFPSKAWFTFLTGLIPRSPESLGEQTIFQLTMWIFFKSLRPCQRKSRWSFLIRLMIAAGAFEDGHVIDWKAGNVNPAHVSLVRYNLGISIVIIHVHFLY